MRRSQASRTAQAIAFTRGVARASPDAGTPLDPLAGELLPPLLSPLLAAVRAAAFTSLGPAMNALSLGWVDHVALRTLAIDEAVREAVGRGVRQLVILGAGLDARAFRLDGLEQVAVFEVDHPATQAEKRERLGTRAPRARELRFVPVDFERVSLEAALAQAGHDATAPTMWLWEGVTPYLPKAATAATLGAIARRSAPTSRLALTYATPEILAARSARLPARAMLRAIGEPLRGLLTPAELGRLLTDAGLVLRWDHAPIELAVRHRRRPGRFPLTPAERLALAEKPG